MEFNQLEWRLKHNRQK